MPYRRQSSLFFMLCCMTLLCVGLQTAFFFIYYHVGGLADALANASILSSFFHPMIYLPLIGFLVIQIVAYGALLAWMWFVAMSLGEWFKFTPKQTYATGLLVWCLTWLFIFLLNAYEYPHSFFATWVLQTSFAQAVLVVDLLILLMATFFAYLNCFFHRRYRGIGISLILLVLAVSGAGMHANQRLYKPVYYAGKPNVILIGLDSLRPDFVSYFGAKEVRTPNIDHFLQHSQVFTEAYSPLARTFPAWVSVLTAKYPLHHQARMNLADPAFIVTNQTLAKQLRAQGYYTLYGTDEPRFTDINKLYGFDRIAGPKGGAVEFILAGLTDLPLTNLLMKLPAAHLLFPYHFANRAADITYQPDQFIAALQQAVARRPAQPMFIAVHFCLSHWPFRWARDGQAEDLTPLKRYANSIEGVDKQLGAFLLMLQQAGLLDHSIVVLFSDHGVTLGMPHDRLISENTYHGPAQLMRTVNVYKRNSAPAFTLDTKRDYGLDTSYGQGTDVLSLKQNHVLLAFKGYGVPLRAGTRHEMSMLIDIAPTILDYLHAPSLPRVDGVSLASRAATSRAMYVETGDRVAATEQNDIDVAGAIQQAAHAYRFDTVTGNLVLTPRAARSMLENKQRAVIWRDWMLALYPAEMRYRPESETGVAKVKGASWRFVPRLSSPYYVLANIKTGEWTVDLSSAFAKRAPLTVLCQQLGAFYGEEVVAGRLLAARQGKVPAIRTPSCLSLGASH